MIKLRLKPLKAKIKLSINGLNAYSLAGIGVGGVIGGGFFLGSSLAISEAGPSVVLAFILGGIIMSQVLGAMTSISINRPVQGSFRVYTEQLLGRPMGFFLGWTYFLSSILVLGSEALASGVFLSYWFSNISPMLLGLIVLVIVIQINKLNIRFFGYIETIMAILKISMLIIFIIAGFWFIINNLTTTNLNNFSNYFTLFPNNINGFFQSMLIIIFTYAGIGTVAMATSEVKNPRKQIPLATILMTLGIISLYVISMFIIISTVKWSLINTTMSPFVQTFNYMNYKWGGSLINITILIATVSVMIGAYYSCSQMLISLSNAGEANKIFSVKNKKGFYFNSWLATALGVLLIIFISFAIGMRFFNYLISAASYFTFFNWIANLLTYLVWTKKRGKEEKYNSPLIKGQMGAIATIFIILFLAAFSLMVEDFRIGFYIALGISLVIYTFYKLLVSKMYSDKRFNYQ